MHIISRTAPTEVDANIVKAEKDCGLALMHLGFDFYKIRPRLLERLNYSIPYISRHVRSTLTAMGNCPDGTAVNDSIHLLAYCWSGIRFTTQVSNHAGKGEPWADSETLVLGAKVWLWDWTAQGNVFATKILLNAIASLRSRTFTPSQVRANQRRTLLEVAAMCDFSADGLVRYALTRLRRAHIDNILDDIILVTFLLGGEGTENSSEFEPITRAFERHRGTSVLLMSLDKKLKDMKFDLDEPNSSPVDKEDMQVISGCLQAYVFGLTGSSSLLPLKRSLECELIRLLACCSTQRIYSQLTDKDKDTISFILSEALMDAFAIRRIVRTALSSIAEYQHSKGRDDSDEPPLLEVFPSLLNSDTKGVWERCFRRLYHQASSFRAISQERKEEIFVCGNVSSIW